MRYSSNLVLIRERSSGETLDLHTHTESAESTITNEKSNARLPTDKCSEDRAYSPRRHGAHDGRDIRLSLLQPDFDLRSMNT